MNWLRSLGVDNRGGIVQKLLAAVALGIILLIVYVVFIKQGDVVVGINVPGEVEAGQIFEAEVTLANNSETAIEDARLVLNMPAGIRLLGYSDRVNEDRAIGEVRPGGVAKETYQLVVLPLAEADAHKLKASALYSTGSIIATLERHEEKELNVKQSDFGLSLEVPETVLLGQSFPATISYRYISSGEESLGKFIALEAPGLKIVSADPAAVGENGGWSLGSGEDGQQIDVRGVISQKGTDLVGVVVRVFIEFDGEKYTLQEVRQNLLVAPSPLTLGISLEDPKEFVSPGELLTYNIVYRNNTGSSLKDAVLRVSLVGDMFDLGTLQTSGSFNASSRVVTWAASTFHELREIENGASGSFTIQVRSKSIYPIAKISDKNFLLRASGILESPTIIPDSGNDRTQSEDTLEVKVAGKIEAIAKALFRDAASGILNEGPFPPRVGVATDYTIHWSIKNYGTDVRNLVVRTKLGDGVLFTGEVSGNTETLPEFNEETREVTWRVDSLRATTGVLGEAPEVIFQVRATPGQSMVGQYMPLTDITTISADDDFTGISLSGITAALTTELPDDSSVGAGDGTVRL